MGHANETYRHEIRVSSFANPMAVDAALRIHLVSRGRLKPFVNVQRIPAQQEPIYIITTESSLTSMLQSFLEARIGRRLPVAFLPGRT